MDPDDELDELLRELPRPLTIQQPVAVKVDADCIERAVLSVIVDESLALPRIARGTTPPPVASVDDAD